MPNDTKTWKAPSSFEMGVYSRESELDFDAGDFEFDVANPFAVRKVLTRHMGSLGALHDQILAWRSQGYAVHGYRAADLQKAGL